jgi:hypothetical protein
MNLSSNVPCVFYCATLYSFLVFPCLWIIKHYYILLFLYFNLLFIYMFIYISVMNTLKIIICSLIYHIYMIYIYHIYIWYFHFVVLPLCYCLITGLHGKCSFRFKQKFSSLCKFHSFLHIFVPEWDIFYLSEEITWCLIAGLLESPSVLDFL